MPLQHPNYKVAVVQAAPAFLDLEAGVDKTVAFIEEASAAGARLIAFPETWLPGYPWWIWLGTPAWAIMKGFVSRYFDNSLSYDSTEADMLRQAARRNGIFVVLGLAERDGGSLYISQWIIGPTGETIAQRRKLKPTHVERAVFGEGDGRGLASGRSAAGSTFNPCRNTPCTRKTNRSTSAPGRAFRFTTHSPMRWVGK
jgi:aliphatic nitrilase